VRWKVRLVVVRHVVARGAVQQATAGIDELDVLHLRGIRGALKHHVLEEVREAAAPLRFEAEPNLVIDADGNHGRSGIRRDHHVQSISQLGGLDPNLEPFHVLPPIAFAFGFFAAKTISNSASMLAGPCASTQAARRFSAS